MKSLKKVLAAVVVVVMVFSSMLIPASADSDKTAGQICESLGVLKGGSNGVDAEYLAKPTQRIQAAIIYLRMLGLEEEAKAYKGTGNFIDATQVAGVSGATNILAYLKANPKLGWVGDGIKFSPLEEVSAQQFYKVMLTVLGYSQGTDFEYKDTLLFAKFKGMGSIANVTKMKNSDMATALVEALGATLKGGSVDDTLIAKLVKAGRISESAAVANGFKVSVTAKIISVAAPAAITVDAGTEKPNLPATVKATMSDGKVTDAAVVWDLSKYSASIPQDYIITGKIAGFEAGVSIKVTVKKLVLDVANVNVSNLRQIVISFNIPVSSESEASKAINYKINNVTPIAASLSSDKKTVTLTTSAQDYMINYATNNKLFISRVVGLSADKTIENIVSKDTEVPSVVSVEAVGPINFMVTFSEPLDERVLNYQAAGSFLVDDGRIGVDGMNVTFATVPNVVNVKLSSPLMPGMHSFKVKSPAEGGVLKDSVGLSVTPNTVSFNFVQDASAITAVVSEASEMYVKIKFNKVLKPNCFKGNPNVLISHTYKGFAPATGASVETSDNVEFTVTFSNPLPPGSVKIWIDYANNTPDTNKIQDNYGNIFMPAELTANVVSDTTKPTATAEFVDSTHIKVVYSEKVIAIASHDANLFPLSAINYANYTLKDSSGNIIPWYGTAPALDASNTVFTLTTATQINGGTLTLTIKNVSDASFARNKINDTTLTIYATDKLPPTVGSPAMAKVSSNKVVINYSEPMDVTTITDKNNYKLGSASYLKELTQNDTIVPFDNNKSVTITFETAPAPTDHIFVGKVKDVSGNWSTWLMYDFGEIGRDNANVTQSAAEVTGSNKIKLTIDGQISMVGTVADYMFRIGSGPWTNVAAISSLSVDTSKNKSYIELVMTTEISDTALSTPVYVATTSNGNASGAGSASPNVRTIDGRTLRVITECADKVAPKFISANIGATSGNRLSTIVLIFSESLYVPSVQDSDFRVEGFEIESVEVNNNIVVISLKPKDNSSGEKPKVTLTGSVEDTKRNVLNGTIEPITNTNG